MEKVWENNSVKNSSGDAVPGRKEQILCKPCSRKNLQTTADVFCSDCDEFQCKECSKAHTVYAFMKNHKLVNATKVKSKSSSFDMNGMDSCEQHGKLLKFFCEDENQLCCSTCAIVDHRKCHSVIEVKKVAGKSRSAGSQLKRKLEEVKSKAEMIVKHTESSKEQFSKDIKAIFMEIKRLRDGINRMFDDLENYVTRETDAFQAEATNKLAKKRSSGEKHIAEVTKSLEIVDTALQNGTPSQQFIVEKTLKKQVNELCRDVDNECKQLQVATVSFRFDETLKLPPLPISACVPGKLTLKFTLPEAKKSVAPVDPIVKLKKITSIDLKQTGDDTREPLYTGLDFLPDGRLVAVYNQNMKCLIYKEKLAKVGSYQLSFMPQSVAVISEEEVAKKSVAPVDPIVKLKKITSIDLKQTGDDTREPLYTGLDFLPDGRLVAVDNQNMKCLIYNEKLVKVGSYQLSFMPQSVVVISEEEVAITSERVCKIDFLRVSKSNEITFKRTCKVMTKYDNICLKDESNFVVATVDDIRPVRIVSMSGEEKDFSISFSNKKYSLRASACSYIRNTEKMILTDCYEHTVYIYDAATNTRVVVKDDQIKYPSGVAIGHSDCILVCSFGTNFIVQISQTGRVLSPLKLDTVNPYRICVSKDQSILAVLIGSEGKMKLQLFKLTGSEHFGHGQAYM